MARTRSAGWIGGAAALIVLILIATYMVGYQPRVTAKNETLAQVEATDVTNAKLQKEVNDLKEEATHVPEYWEQINAIAVQLPKVAKLADYIQVIRETAAANGVTITELGPAIPTTMVIPTPEVPAVPAPEPTPGPTEPTAPPTEGTETPAPDVAAGDGEVVPVPAVPAVPEQIDGFVAMPIMIKVLGNHDTTMAFLDTLQTREGRLFLASNIETQRQPKGPPSGGRPATNDGDIELTINGYLWVLQDLEGITPVEEGKEPVEEPEETMPSSPVNPYVPLFPTP